MIPKNKSLKEINFFMKIKRWLKNIFSEKVDNEVSIQILEEQNRDKFLDKIKIEDNDTIIQQLESIKEPLTFEQLEKLNGAYSRKIDNIINNIEKKNQANFA